MDEASAQRLTDLTADLMMVIGRMKRSALPPEIGGIHPGTEFAILDTIARHGCRTVPEIAALRGVARQSVQAVVNKMIDVGLVGQQDNPDHKSSRLLALEPKGMQQYELVRGLLCGKYAEKDTPLRKGDLEATARVLAVIADTWGLNVGEEALGEARSGAAS